jgi:hypothetical protein
LYTHIQGDWSYCRQYLVSFAGVAFITSHRESSRVPQRTHLHPTTASLFTRRLLLLHRIIKTAAHKTRPRLRLHIIILARTKGGPAHPLLVLLHQTGLPAPMQAPVNATRQARTHTRTHARTHAQTPADRRRQTQTHAVNTYAITHRRAQTHTHTSAYTHARRHAYTALAHQQIWAAIAL